MVVGHDLGKLRYLPLQPDTAVLIDEYLQVAGHREVFASPPFRPAQDGRLGPAAEGVSNMHLTRKTTLKVSQCRAVGPECNQTGDAEPVSAASSWACNALQDGAHTFWTLPKRVRVFSEGRGRCLPHKKHDMVAIRKVVPPLANGEPDLPPSAVPVIRLG